MKLNLDCNYTVLFDSSLNGISIGDKSVITIKLNLDYNYTSLINLSPNGIPYGDKSIEIM